MHKAVRSRCEDRSTEAVVLVHQGLAILRLQLVWKRCSTRLRRQSGLCHDVGREPRAGSALRYHAPVPYRDGSLKAREFTFLCEDRILAALPPGLPPPERRVRWTMLQLHFGDARTHFELQPRMKQGVVEAGLHFEGPPDANAAWAELLAAHAADLLGELGPAWELEEWTASWRRLHRTFPFARLTPELAGEVSAELARAMATLHPLLVAGGGAP